MASTFTVGSWKVDRDRNIISSNGSRIHLEPKAMDVLVRLAESAGQTLSKDEIIKSVWPDTFVGDDALTRAIYELRKAFGDDIHEPQIILTVPRRGYRLIAVVTQVEEPPAAAPAPAERKGEPPPRPAVLWRSWTIFIALLFAALSLGGTGYWWHVQRSAADANSSIAVLPLDDLSQQHQGETFSEGLAEEVLNRLTKVPNLKVTARSSAFQFKGKHEDPKVIGKKLNVANLLEGSVQFDGTRVRISVHLTHIDSGLTLWSETYDRDFKDVFAIEDEIATAVSQALLPKLLGQQRSHVVSKSATTTQEAYEAFLQARYFGRRNDPESEQKALTYLDRAIELDPNYAPAYALRSIVTAESGDYGRTDLALAMKRSRLDAEMAIQLDPTLPAGYLALSESQGLGDWNWTEAEKSVQKALDLAPGDADAFGQQGYLFWVQGRQTEAINVMQRGLALDPLQPVKHLYYAMTLRDLGRYPESEFEIEKVLELDPRQVWTHETLGEVYLAQGNFEKALAEMNREPAGPWQDFGRALAFAALGQRSNSDAELKKFTLGYQNVGAFQIAQIYAYRGETNLAFEWLDRAFRQRDGGLGNLKTNWILRPLRSDARYAQLLKKVNLSD